MTAVVEENCWKCDQPYGQPSTECSIRSYHPDTVVVDDEVEDHLQPVEDVPQLSTPTVPIVPAASAPAPVDGAAILDEVHAAVSSYVVFPSPEAHDAVTLWVAATPAQPAWEHAPRACDHLAREAVWQVTAYGRVRGAVLPPVGDRQRVHCCCCAIDLR